MSGWINIEDRLPKQDEDVLFFCEWTGASGTKYREIRLSTLSIMRFLGITMLYWIPLPEPPKEAKDGKE